MLPLREFPFAVRPMIVAHRGDTSLGAQENSTEAISTALISGADMIEIDVQWSADEVFVCYHDEFVHGSTRAVHEQTLSELREVHICTLQEILELARGRIYFNIEIKEYSSRDPKRFMQKLVALVAKLGFQEYALLSSFRIDYLREAGWALPTVVIHPSDRMLEFFNERSYQAALKTAKPLASYLPSELMQLASATGYACQLEELTPQAIADVAKFNIMLSVYTVTNEAEFDSAIAKGAKALVCERPHDFAALRNSRFPDKTHSGPEENV